LLYNGPLLCGFNVAIKGLIIKLFQSTEHPHMLPHALA